MRTVDFITASQISVLSTSLTFSHSIFSAPLPSSSSSAAPVPFSSLTDLPVPLGRKPGVSWLLYHQSPFSSSYQVLRFLSLFFF